MLILDRQQRLIETQNSRLYFEASSVSNVIAFALIYNSNQTTKGSDSQRVYNLLSLLFLVLSTNNNNNNKNIFLCVFISMGTHTTKKEKEKNLQSQTPSNNNNNNNKKSDFYF
jgi:hypothetical protein